MFASAAVRQAALLYSGAIEPWALEAGALGEVALLVLALGGLGALRAIQRTTQERDRVEDLHWDSMEAVRIMSELAARPGAQLEDKLATMLDLGAARFGLELGIAWQGDAEGSGHLLGARAAGLDDAQRDAWVAEAAPRLRDVCRSTRPVLWFDRDATPRTFFGVSVASGGRVHGALAFLGRDAVGNRFTATDKDLLGLMAQWLATELERRSSPQDIAPSEPVAPGAPAAREEAEAPTLARVARRRFRPRAGLDLNDSIQRLERRLRQRVGVDGTLALHLARELSPVTRGQLSLPRLVESLVDAAARLSPSARLELSTAPAGDGTPEVILRVAVRGSGIDARALERLFAESGDEDEAPHGALPLARLERLLRGDGGELSVSIEPDRGAVFTAWLPADRQVQRPLPSRGQPPGDQPSR